MKCCAHLVLITPFFTLPQLAASSTQAVPSSTPVPKSMIANASAPDSHFLSVPTSPTLRAPADVLVGPDPTTLIPTSHVAAVTPAHEDSPASTPASTPAVLFAASFEGSSTQETGTQLTTTTFRLRGSKRSPSEAVQAIVEASEMEAHGTGNHNSEVDNSNGSQSEAEDYDVGGVQLKSRGYFPIEDKEEHGHKKDCLCTFDIDRTLTGAQGEKAKCKHDIVVGPKKVEDKAFKHGHLMLSEVGQSLGGTACEKCYVGIISLASEVASKEQEILRTKMGGHERVVGHRWTKWTGGAVSSSLVYGCEQKPEAAKKIKELIEKTHKGTKIKHQWHFDDDRTMVHKFHAEHMGARQVSCDIRDHSTPGCSSGKCGLCGAKKSEIQFENKYCKSQ